MPLLSDDELIARGLLPRSRARYRRRERERDAVPVSDDVFQVPEAVAVADVLDWLDDQPAAWPFLDKMVQVAREPATLAAALHFAMTPAAWDLAADFVILAGEFWLARHRGDADLDAIRADLDAVCAALGLEQTAAWGRLSLAVDKAHRREA